MVYTIVIVKQNAVSCNDIRQDGIFLLGELIALYDTDDIFSNPKGDRPEKYINESHMIGNEKNKK